jgi:hypothetical protein
MAKNSRRPRNGKTTVRVINDPEYARWFGRAYAGS